MPEGSTTRLWARTPREQPQFENGIESVHKRVDSRWDASVLALGSAVRIAWIATILLMGPLAGCVEDDGTDGGSPAKATSSSGAEFLVKGVAAAAADGVVAKLSQGDHRGTVVQGLAGRAIATGRVSFTNNANCGTSCVESVSNTEVVLQFENFRAAAGTNSEATVTGRVVYRDDSWNRQSGGSYSSGGSTAVGGEGVRARYTFTDNGRTTGWDDTIAFSASAASPSGIFRGSCTPSNGQTYTF